VDGETKSPLILWHLLSLDAPTVAATWTWFLAAANHVHLPWTAPVSMAIAVWLLYAADRLLDTEDLEPRHRFHHRHRGEFLSGIVIASFALAFLLPYISSESIHLYLVLAGFVFGYFVVIHATRSAHRLPKELAVGVCFAAATFIPTVSRRPDLRIALLAPAILFAALCSLNCLFIYAWEHAATPSSHPPHWTTPFALRHLTALASINAVASVALALFDHRCPWFIPAAIALSTALLLALHARRDRYSVLTLRATADLVLLTPFFFLPFA
jgi:hypothetical protein